jgi:23S rRNA (guanine745-N1)-methyltransferase
VKNGCPDENVIPMFAAANIFSLPVADECADVFTSLFAPLPEDEVRRVLRPGGVLVICAAGADHLSEMRGVLYENPIPSGGGATVPEGFTTVQEKIIEYKIDLTSKEEIMSLFTMTQFYHNAPAEGREKLCRLEKLTVTVQVKCTVAVKL